MTDVVFEAPTGSFRRFVDMGDGTHAEQGIAHPPFDLLTDGGDGPNRRLRVDVGHTGFFAGAPLNQAINASVTSENPVGFPAGTYYIKLINTNGATATGVFRARWEERP